MSQPDNIFVGKAKTKQTQMLHFVIILDFVFFFHHKKNICSEYLLVSPRGACNEYRQHMFLIKKLKTITKELSTNASP